MQEISAAKDQEVKARNAGFVPQNVCPMPGSIYVLFFSKLISNNCM
jgi:hypothetical protein